MRDKNIFPKDIGKYEQELANDVKQIYNSLKKTNPLSYVPVLSDFYLGYEYEEFKDGEWISKSFAKDFFSSDFDIKVIADKLYPKFIRTPYLTKEQIEKEGWVFNKNYGCLVKDTKINGVQRRVELSYKEDNHWLTLKYDCGEYLSWNLFDGECLSINEFRKIIKWLGIKKT